MGIVSDWLIKIFLYIYSRFVNFLQNVVESQLYTLAKSDLETDDF